MDFWRHINTQWRATGFGVVGLDWPALFRIAEHLDTRLSQHDFLKLRHLENMELERINTKDDT